MIELDKSLFEGYISEVDDGVWISAIKSKKIGNGDFSRLVKQLKEKYNWIKIPTPSNMMIEIAEHLGFVKKEEYFGEPFNEMGIILFWTKLNTNGEIRCVSSIQKMIVLTHVGCEDCGKKLNLEEIL